MEIVEMIIIALQITTVFAKKKHRNDRHMSSDESIENLLYFKDCKHKKEATEAPVVREAKPVPPACPCPRMCCSMCCDCDAPQSFIGRQMAPLQQLGIEPLQSPQQPAHHPVMPVMPVQPQIMQRDGKKKRMKKNNMMQPPISGRRDIGFTRENIKSLISRDQDIKKILKDLVRVTMHKVDLVEKVKARRAMDTTTTETPTVTDEDYID